MLAKAIVISLAVIGALTFALALVLFIGVRYFGWEFYISYTKDEE